MITNNIEKGEIYIIKNKVNGKAYVGQASKYVSLNNNKWGTIGRWKSHVAEATRGANDHCVLLNNAIRKYGSHNFEVTKICDCMLTEMDELEKNFIKEYNTLSPHGYNMTIGGQKEKTDSEITRQNKKNANIDRGTHSDETKQNISKGQLGNRREGKRRKYEEDYQLPKYICALRQNEKIVTYFIRSFPIGIDKKDYIDKAFYVRGGDTEEAKQRAIAYLDELKEKYNYVDKAIQENKTQQEKKNSVAKIIEKVNKKITSEYVIPIFQGGKLLGYAVEGMQDSNGDQIPRREFTDKTNVWNLDNAYKYVDQVKQLVEDVIHEDWLNFDLMKRVNTHQRELPKYIKAVFVSGKHTGYKVLSFPLNTETGITKVTRFFTKTKKSLEDNLAEAKHCLHELFQQDKEYLENNQKAQVESVPEPEVNKQLIDIYLIRNMVNGMCYIGKTSQYIYNGTKKCGYESVWKRIVKEIDNPDLTVQSSVKLHDAMKEHGIEAFEISKLTECEEKDVKALRAKFIQEYNSIHPNGYNLTDGIVMCDDTIKKMKSNRVITEEFRSKMSSIILGARRDKQVRKHSEDDDLPKYISAKRKNGQIIGYQVLKYPIGKDKAQYITKLFKSIHDPKAALQKAMVYLEELKLEYPQDS